MPLIAVRNSGAVALFDTPINGAGLSDAAAQSLKSELDQAKALIDAIKAAMEAARDAGQASFAPTSALLQLPAGLDADLRDELFIRRMDRSFSGSDLSLQEWSQAVGQLERYVGAAQSQLPASLGGGIVNLSGIWYVNGQAYNLGELYLANRVNTYAEMDRLLTQSLNTIAANNQVVNDMTETLGELTTKLQEWVGGGSTRDAWALFGGILFIPSVGGWGDKDTTGVFSSFITWSTNTYGSDSQASRISTTLNYNTLANVRYSRSDALKLRDEMQAFMESKSADNQVAQMRTESIFTTRANLLEGMGAFMKGQQNSAAMVSRNIT